MSEETNSQETANIVESGDSQSEQQTETSPDLGSGQLADEVLEESNLVEPIQGEKAQALDELAEKVEEAIEEGKSEEEIQKLVEVFKYKANGKEYEETIDWTDKETIRKKLELAAAARPAMQEKAEWEKRFKSETERLKQDPWAVLEELGLDPVELAAKRIEAEVERQKMSPEQLRLLELEEKERQWAEKERLWKEAEEKRIEEERAAQFQRLQEEAAQEFTNQINDALSASTILPNTPFMQKRVADALLAVMEAGRKDIKAKDIIPNLEKEYRSEFQSLMKNIPVDRLDDLMGQEVAERFRKARLEKMKTVVNSEVKETGKQKLENKPKPKQKLKDFFGKGI